MTHPIAPTMPSLADEMIPDEDRRIFTVWVAGERFGIPIAAVETVFRIGSITHIPLAPPAVTGLVNLRGRIITAISLRRCLNLADTAMADTTAIGIDHNGEAFALVVDEPGDVLSLPDVPPIQTPRHMRTDRAKLTKAVHSLDSGLLCILDMPALFNLPQLRAVA